MDTQMSVSAGLLLTRRRLLCVTGGMGLLAKSGRGLAQVPATADATERRTAMDIKRNGSRPSSTPPEAYFTGAVRVEPVFQVGDPVRRTHIAVQESLNGKNVDWMEKVSDEQYRR